MRGAFALRCSLHLFDPLLRAVRRHLAEWPPSPPFEGPPVAPAPAPPVLTERDAQVGRLLAAEGLSDAEIAARLGVIVHTVRTHVAGLRRKLGVSGRAKVRRRVAPPGVGRRGGGGPASGLMSARHLRYFQTDKTKSA